MTVLHAGGKFDKGSYKVSGGLHGVGVSCVNALSTDLKATVYRNGKIYEQEYKIGKPQYDVKEVGTTEKSGTQIWFKPDASIFTETVYSFDTLSHRLRELAFLNKGIRLTLMDRRDTDDNGEFLSTEYYSDRGLAEFVEFIDEGREKLIPDTMFMEGEKNGIPVEISMQYNTSFSENLHSYVNNINTREGGDATSQDSEAALQGR